MAWLLYIAIGLAVLFAIIMVWGGLHLRQSRKKAELEIKRIELADIEPLARECVKVFEKKLGSRLDLGNCDETAQKLDDAFKDGYKLKQAFARDGFYWYFVKPVGACLGELLRLHAGHEWIKEAGEAPQMKVRLKEGESTVYPFDKVFKQLAVGESGDLVAFVEFAKTVDRVAERIGDQ